MDPSVRTWKTRPTPSGRVAVVSADVAWRWRVAALLAPAVRCDGFPILSMARASGWNFDALIVDRSFLTGRLLAELRTVRTGQKRPAVVLVTEAWTPDSRVHFGLLIDGVHLVATEAEHARLVSELLVGVRRAAVKAVTDDLGLSPPVRHAIEALFESLQRGGAVITGKGELARRAGYHRSHLSRKGADDGVDLGRLIDVTRAGRGADLRRALGLDWRDLVAPVSYGSQGGLTQLWLRVFDCAPTEWTDDGVTSNERLLRALERFCA